MKPTPIQNPSASKGEFHDPPPKPTLHSGCELHPGLTAMVRALPFSRIENENPCHHLHEFEEMCLYLSISGITQETLRWKLFPFSLMEKAKQWYTHAVGSTNGDWEELKDMFCLAFLPMSRIDSLPRAILDFKQYEWESIGASWAWFSTLIHAGLDLSLPKSVLLHLFCSSLAIEAALYLDMTIEGSFTHKTMMEQKKNLAHILEKHASSIVEPKPPPKEGHVKL